MRSPLARPVRHAATLAGFVLLLFPVLIGLALFAWNARLLEQHRTVQQNATEASALAAARAMVDDRMLVGTDAAIEDLEDLGRVVARFYSTLNPLPSGFGPTAALSYEDGDIVFEHAASPLDTTRKIVESVTLAGRRTASRGNAVPTLGGGFLANGRAEVVSVARVLFDRRVRGLKPIYDNNVPLAPIAIRSTVWTEQAESVSPPGPVTIDLSGSDVLALDLGISDSTEWHDQIVHGVSPAQFASLGVPFVIDAAMGLVVPRYGAISGTMMKPSLQAFAENASPCIWPLFAEANAESATILRLVAARVTAIADTTDPMTGEIIGTSVTLTPCFLSTPAALTDTAREVNPYLCRIRLANATH